MKTTASLFIKYEKAGYILAGNKIWLMLLSNQCELF